MSVPHHSYASQVTSRLGTSSSLSPHNCRKPCRSTIVVHYSKASPSSLAIAPSAHECPGKPAALRRSLLLGGLATFFAPPAGASQGIRAGDLQAGDLPGDPCRLPAGVDDYSLPGPFEARRLPKIEHVCERLNPRCTGNQCLLQLDVVYPKGCDEHPGVASGKRFPLAILSGGFLVPRLSYLSYAQRLASWGFVVVLYDKVETALDTMDDVLSVEFIQEIMNYAEDDRVFRGLADPRHTYLLGHSRGAKLSVLAAAKDDRVCALCLIDPVDNTVWAPNGPRYPSATAELAQARAIPTAVIGGGVASDCVPKSSNFRGFYNACVGPAWEVVIQQAGHFQFLDDESTLQRAICTSGSISDQAVREATQGVAVSWGVAMVKQRRLAAPVVSRRSQGGVLLASTQTVPPVDRAVDIVAATEERIERDNNTNNKTPPDGGVIVGEIRDTVDIVAATEERIERRIRDGVIQGKGLPVEMESQYKNMRFL